ncbi:MAG: TIGR03435 family protein [Edaphobacter sp.]
MTIDNRNHHLCTRKLLLLALALSITALCASGRAQAPQNAPTAKAAAQPDATSAKLPVYDVVSIKPNKSGNGAWGWGGSADSYTGTNLLVKNLLQAAYDIKPDLISGVSGPIDSARFDVIAKIIDPDPAVMKKLTDKQRQAMLLPFLIERFQLKAHTEIKILPVYELVVLPGGPKFKQSSDKSQQGAGWSTNGSHGTLTAHSLPITSLASLLTDVVHRTVIDKTDLTGKYEITLKWSQYDGTDPPADSGPSIFTALPEQLGLKLKPAKGPVETLVVDHIAMPSEN